jgi:hypothetical protein
MPRESLISAPLTKRRALLQSGLVVGQSLAYSVVTDRVLDGRERLDCVRMLRSFLTDNNGFNHA